MRNHIAQIKEELGSKLSTVSALDGLQVIESAFKKTIKELFTEMKGLAPEEKREAGQLINELKNHFEAKFKRQALRLKSHLI